MLDDNHHEDELIEVCIICNVRGRKAIEACPCVIKRTVTYSKEDLDELDGATKLKDCWNRSKGKK